MLVTLKSPKIFKIIIAWNLNSGDLVCLLSLIPSYSYSSHRCNHATLINREDHCDARSMQSRLGLLWSP